MNGIDNYGNESVSDSGDNGGNDGSECDIDVEGGSGSNFDNDDRFHNGGDFGMIMAKMADFIMVRIMVLVMEKMMLDVAMIDTMLSIWKYYSRPYNRYIHRAPKDNSLGRLGYAVETNSLHILGSLQNKSLILMLYI